MRGLKFIVARGVLAVTSRTPSGVRGLKLNVLVVDFADKIASHPVRGAWIEMHPRSSAGTAGGVASRQGCVD